MQKFPTTAERQKQSKTTTPLVLYQGEPFSYSHLAVVGYFGENVKSEGIYDNEEALDRLEAGYGDYAVMAVENSLAGFVPRNYELLVERNMYIVGEYILPSVHTLCSVNMEKKSSLSPSSELSSEEKLEERLSHLKRVLSHPVALEQCSFFFEQYPWIEKTMYYDSGAAAKYVSETQDPTIGVICPPEAAKHYNLEVIDPNLTSNNETVTRFIIVSSKPEFTDDSDKCSLALYLAHRPGTLYTALGIFAKKDLNICSMRSWPVEGKPFEYCFYADFEMPKGGKILGEQAIEEAKKVCVKVQLLGFYKAHKLY